LFTKIKKAGTESLKYVKQKFVVRGERKQRKRERVEKHHSSKYGTKQQKFVHSLVVLLLELI